MRAKRPGTTTKPPADPPARVLDAPAPPKAAILPERAPRAAICKAPDCGQAFESTWHRGQRKLYCSETCRRRHFDAKRREQRRAAKEAANGAVDWPARTMSYADRVEDPAVAEILRPPPV
jgi:hypothetical protein